ncbi:MAG: hypothetical protein QOI95_2085 [Acidimicrobiaceae bacterium]|jgi:uncharacterized protein YndB with AHSA1/START domain
MTRHTSVEHHIDINRPIEEVFAYVADARNDPLWCPRVLSCEQIEGDGAALGARYTERHNPTFMRPKVRDLRIIAFEAPTLVRWIQEDANGVFHIDYTLEPIPNGARFGQHDEIDWKISPMSVEVGRRIVPRHIRQQFARLKHILETSPSARSMSN